LKGLHVAERGGYLDASFGLAYDPLLAGIPFDWLPAAVGVI